MVGTLDLNQCLRLPDEITGMKPEVSDTWLQKNRVNHFLSRVQQSDYMVNLKCEIC